MNASLIAFTAWMFRWRSPLIAVFAVLTAVMTWFAVHLRVDASFEKSLPQGHPYIATFTQYQAQFGGANRVIVALMARQGDMFTPEFFRELQRATDEVTFLPAVNRSQVQSLFTPNVRYLEVVEDGLSAGNVIPPGFTPGPAGFARVKENILKSGKLGQLVANDFSGAIVSAQLLEVDPRTGERIDYAKVAAGLEQIRQRIERDSHGTLSVHVIGFAKIIGDVRDGAMGVLALFGVSVLVTALLVWNYAGRWKLALAPVLCSLVAVIWQLGALTALGFGIDPFSILVPFLVFAIGVSHGVQKICTFRNEAFKGQDGPAAAQAAFMQLIVPGIVALMTDTVGFITMLVIRIPTIQELAITASLGVAVIIITNFFLLPLLLSYLHLPPSYARWVAARRQSGDRLWARLVKGLSPLPSLTIIATGLGLGVWGAWVAGRIHIGDTQAGVPELRQESRYNADTRVITTKFNIGVDVLTVIVETPPNGCVDHEVVTLMDEFEGAVRAVPAVRSVISLPSMAKIVNSAFSEGALKWRVLPRNEQALAQAVSPIETSTGLLHSDASDEVVKAAERPILYWVFGAVIVLCLITFRSVRATLCIVVPLAIVNYLAYALMVYLGIGLKTSTLPMVALGVGIGVDYGIYIFALLQSSLRAGAYFEDAMYDALKDAGAAVMFTGFTLAIGVSTWVFSELKFQADMGVLLTFMFLVNMVGAIILLPAMARWFWHHRSSARSANIAPAA